MEFYLCGEHTIFLFMFSTLIVVDVTPEAYEDSNGIQQIRILFFYIFSRLLPFARRNLFQDTKEVI